MRPSSAEAHLALVGLGAFCHSRWQTELSQTLWYVWLDSQVASAAEIKCWYELL